MITEYRFVSVIYGDLEFDGTEEAAVLLTRTFRNQNGETWDGAEFFAFTLRDGQVVPMGHAPVSNVPKPMLKIDERQLELYYIRDNLLCSEHFRLSNGRLMAVGHECGE